MFLCFIRWHSFISFFRLFVLFTSPCIKNGKLEISCYLRVRVPQWYHAAETARRVNDVYGGCVAKENTVRFWFQSFRSGNFDLHNKPRG
ncbi:unnamed protein product [Diatraea saccharalis]|uniref:Mos1 transposase HTH domain-containing protein n=1 Tax=Diatraea saccharalis TaxID=40085 RepID=A0A9N9WF47_9NEOP|nr:unnamed protein product [Diatraea saccharalis]